MHVERLGNGEMSLILHGFAGSGVEMVPLAQRLPGRKLIPDLPGHGATGVLEDPTAYTMDATIEALVALIADEGARDVDIVGYSMGGRVALAMAANRPDLVRTVVAIGARTGISDDGERADRLDRDRLLADEIVANGAEWFADRWVSGPLYDTQRRLGADHMAEVMGRRRSIDPVGIAHSLREVGPAAQPDLSAELAKSGVPTLLLVGELDERFRVIADAIAEVTPSATVTAIPGSGHATHVEELGATSAAIVGFWETM